MAFSWNRQTMAVQATRRPFGEGLNFEGVAPPYGQKQAFDGMKTIFPALSDLQTEVDFGVGKSDSRDGGHGSKLGSAIEVAVLLEFTLIVAPVFVHFDAQFQKDLFL